MENDQEIREYQREYLDFLDDEVRIFILKRGFHNSNLCTNFRRISEYIPRRSRI